MCELTKPSWNHAQRPTKGLFPKLLPILPVGQAFLTLLCCLPQASIAPAFTQTKVALDVDLLEARTSACIGDEGSSDASILTPCEENDIDGNKPLSSVAAGNVTQDGARRISSSRSCCCVVM